MTNDSDMMDQVGGALAKAGGRARAVGVLGDGDVAEEDPRAESRLAPRAKAKHGAKAKGAVPAKPASAAKVGAKAPAPAKAAGPPALAPPAKASASSASEFAVSKASSPSAPAPPALALGAVRRPRTERKWKDAIGGGHCVFEEYKGPRLGRKTEYANWMFKCPHVGPGHDFPSCERTMGLGKKNTEKHGDIEPHSISARVARHATRCSAWASQD